MYTGLLRVPDVNTDKPVLVWDTDFAVYNILVSYFQEHLLISWVNENHLCMNSFSSHCRDSPEHYTVFWEYSILRLFEYYDNIDLPLLAIDDIRVFWSQ